MRNNRALRLTIFVIVTAALSACASAQPRPSTGSGSATVQPGGGAASRSTGTCVAAGGSRCAGPAPVLAVLYVDHGGSRLHGLFACGGRLTATEMPQRVSLTYTATAVRRGGMACARIDLGVQLARPLGTRTVIDAVTGMPVRVVRAAP